MLVTLAQFGAMTAKWALLERRSLLTELIVRLIKRHYVRLQN